MTARTPSHILRRALLILAALAGLAPGSATAQYYFGRNKVIYHHFDWRILQTEHFDIYYYPEMRELTEIGAAWAEESYRFLENKLSISLNERIPLIFYATHAHFQETNTLPYLIPEGVGGFFEYIKGRVVVPANGSIPDFKKVIRHELVHVFTHAKANRVLKEHKQFNNPGLPLWFSEGLAEYWSSGWNSEAEMFIRDAVISGYLYPVAAMYQINGTFLMYKEGQSLLRFIDTHWGEDKILQLIDNVWMAPYFSEVMSLTLGLDLREFDERWSYALKKERYPLLQDNDAASRVSMPVTREGINVKPAFWQAESARVVFISNRNGYANIYQTPLRGGPREAGVEVLVAGERSEAFESFHLLNSAIDVNRRGELAFISKAGERDRLYVMVLPGKEITGRYAFDNLVSLYSPSWSPDGNRIVFSGLAFSGRRDLYLFEPATQQLTPLTADTFDDKDPAFSPDGRLIAFSSDRGAAGAQGGYTLFVYDLAEGTITPVTTGVGHDQMPAWSPDSSHIAFVSDRSGTQNIWALPAPVARPSLASRLGLQAAAPPHSTAAAAPRQLTHFITGAYDPEWTPQGDLLFTVFEKFSFNIGLLKGLSDSLKEQPATAALAVAPDSTAAAWNYPRLSGAGESRDLRYKPKYSLDIAQSQITQDPIFGTSGGMQLAVSDMLGNYQYFFLLYNTARVQSELLSSFNFAVSRVDLSHRTNFAVGLFHFAGQYYNRYDYWFWERRYGGYTALSYPLSKFNRVEASLNVRHSDKEWFLSDYRRKALLVSNFISYVQDNSLWGPTGPLDGSRMNFTLGTTVDVAHENVRFLTAIADYRRYFRISNQSAHALRIWAQINNGKESTPFYMGGSWDLRGYRLWSLWGTKIAMVSNELRFPFIDRFMLKFPIGGVALSSIRGALFLDLGNAWDKRMPDLLGSTGFGVRCQLGGMLVLRFDTGRKFVLADPARFYQWGEYHFDRAWFTQFFFGWDF
ncbi:MAG TPA: BamA/TamA family outer membrane protein [bacterium]|mgnify:CR=1 FL=1|nr:BamA/TamA family outer membrane protein [bacterium]HPR87622.1 BamA/TamA family outer membrane protein [bacterium]